MNLSYFCKDYGTKHPFLTILKGIVLRYKYDSGERSPSTAHANRGSTFAQE